MFGCGCVARSEDGLNFYLRSGVGDPYSSGYVLVWAIPYTSRSVSHRTDDLRTAMLYWWCVLVRQVLGIAMKTRALTIAILLLGAAGVASADQDDSHRGAGKSHHWSHDRRASALEAPEIDPAGMVVALTLLGGAFAVVRARRGMHPTG